MGCGAGGTAAEVTEEEEEEGVEVVERSRGGGVACQTLADSVVMVRASDERLKKATLDLNNMVGGRSSSSSSSSTSCSWSFKHAWVN
jgi:hypothetical protein